MKIPRIYLGTMTFGWQQSSQVVDTSVATEMLKAFHEAGHSYVDTARIYSSGSCESIMGAAVRQSKVLSFKFGSKAHPSQGSLSAACVEEQLTKSLAESELPSFDEYFLHSPDSETPLLESLVYLHSQVLNGKVKAIGLSNYHAAEVARAFELCKEHSLTPPSVYQGLYNPLNRMVEDELLPVLRANNCRFVAYNPLAGGLLTGKHDLNTVPQGRFKDNPNYLGRFFTPANFEAVSEISKACEEAGWQMVEAAYVWSLRHSSLTPDDGLLLGASSAAQLSANLAAVKRAEEEEAGLPEEVRAAFDKAYDKTREGAFPYWRGYSADMPGREDLDQGGAYAVFK